VHDLEVVSVHDLEVVFSLIVSRLNIILFQIIVSSRCHLKYKSRVLFVLFTEQSSRKL
jgi:hypothetical protein